MDGVVVGVCGYSSFSNNESSILLLNSVNREHIKLFNVPHMALTITELFPKSFQMLGCAATIFLYDDLKNSRADLPRVILFGHCRATLFPCTVSTYLLQPSVTTQKGLQPMRTCDTNLWSRNVRCSLKDLETSLWSAQRVTERRMIGLTLGDGRRES